MKSDPKHKHNPSSKIKHHHQEQNNFITYATNTLTKHHQPTLQHTDQQHCFHLHDEQPQSINAKLKLEQFSICLNEQKAINSNQRTNNTVNLLKRSISKKEEEHQNAGWGDYQHHAKQQKGIINQIKKPSTTSNTKRLYSTTRNSLTSTLHIKVKGDKKPSLPLNNYYSPQRKINLTFNNLIPDQMQLIRQQEISNEIIKKVKSLQTKKPMSASYYAASQKILTLFNKDQQSGIKAGESMRIHSSVKDQQTRGNNQSMVINDKQKMLKTFSFDTFYGNDNQNKLHAQQLSKKDILNRVTRFNQTTNNIQKLNTQIKQPYKIPNKKSHHHHRTYSQPIDNSSTNRNKSNSKMNLSHKKYKMISDKKNKYIWGVNSERVYNKKQQQQSIDGRQENEGVKNQGYGYFSGRSDSKIIANSKRQAQSNNYNSNQKDQNQSLTKHNNLSQDFSLLINLLKQQNQHVLGGQLHSYLTQAKHNIQYNYYMSSTISKKHPSKNSFNHTLKINKSNHNSRKLTNINNTSISNRNHTDNNRIVNTSKQEFNNHSTGNDKNVNKSNTARQYVPFSASKHRSKTNNFLISASQII